MRGRTFFAALWLAAGSSPSAAETPPICADRPSRSTGECTVPAGHWQIETGLIDWSREKADGVSTDLAALGSSLIKYGVGDNADVELQITPFETLRVHGGGIRERHSSFGDLILRGKYRATRADAPVLLAVDPFVKLPTANHHLGNGKVEGGLLVATSAQLGNGGLTLSFDPELDAVADADGHGRHAATQQVANLGFAVNEKLSLSVELWGRWDWDPAVTQKQASADGSIAYLVSNNAQLDAGVNFGINRQTPDVELYSGVSLRF
jgi:hypothetical protein